VWGCTFLSAKRRYPYWRRRCASGTILTRARWPRISARSSAIIKYGLPVDTHHTIKAIPGTAMKWFWGLSDIVNDSNNATEWINADSAYKLRGFRTYPLLCRDRESRLHWTDALQRLLVHALLPKQGKMGSAR
jgi:hypothetical protein